MPLQTKFWTNKLPFSCKRAAHLRLGEKGERLACRLLQELGIKILLRNYRSGHGEIDIVALDEDVLCFVEVKTRSNPKLYDPRFAVHKHKRRLLLRTARHYLACLDSQVPVQCRHDIVEVIREGKQFTIIRYWKDAFRAEAYRKRSRP